MNSYRTTVLGLCIIIGALADAGAAYFDSDAATVIDVPTLIGIIMGGVACIVARDNSVTSEDAGARRKTKGKLPGCVVLVCGLGITLGCGGCATIRTVSESSLTNDLGQPETVHLSTLGVAFGKAALEELAQDATQRWEADGSGEMTTGSTAAGVSSDWAAIMPLLEKLIELAVQPAPVPDPLP